MSLPKTPVGGLRETVRCSRQRPSPTFSGTVFGKNSKTTTLRRNIGAFRFLNTLFWRLATLALRLPSPQLGLTTVFGMRTGVTPATKHQNRIFKYQRASSLTCEEQQVKRFWEISERKESLYYATPTIPFGKRRARAKGEQALSSSERRRLMTKVI